MAAQFCLLSRCAFHLVCVYFIYNTFICVRVMFGAAGNCGWFLYRKWVSFIIEWSCMAFSAVLFLPRLSFGAPSSKLNTDGDEFLMENLLLMSCFVAQTLIISMKCTLDLTILELRHIETHTKWKQTRSLLCVNEILYEFNVVLTIFQNDFLLRTSWPIATCISESFHQKTNVWWFFFLFGSSSKINYV